MTLKREDLCKVFSEIPPLKTERLILRGMREEDAEDMYEYASKAEVTEFLLWSPHVSVAYTKEYLKYIESRYLLGDFFDWAITLADGGKMIGTCGFTRIDTVNNSAEIGYVLNPEYHRMGFAPEAADAVLRFGFLELGLHRIEAKFMSENHASGAVMEKLGMTFEGFGRDSMLVKGVYRTIGTYSIMDFEYFRNKK